MIGDFAQAAGRLQESPAPNTRQQLRQQWQVVLRTIAPADAELALSFMYATRTFVQIGNAEQEEPKSAACVWNSPRKKRSTIHATPSASPRKTCRLPATCLRNSSIC
jgi:hypothetical protein